MTSIGGSAFCTVLPVDFCDFVYFDLCLLNYMWEEAENLHEHTYTITDHVYIIMLKVKHKVIMLH